MICKILDTCKSKNNALLVTTDQRTLSVKRYLEKNNADIVLDEIQQRFPEAVNFEKSLYFLYSVYSFN